MDTTSTYEFTNRRTLINHCKDNGLQKEEVFLQKTKSGSIFLHLGEERAYLSKDLQEGLKKGKKEFPWREIELCDATETSVNADTGEEEVSELMLAYKVDKVDTCPEALW